MKKIMKKIIVGAVATLMSFSSLTGTPAFAAEEYTLNINYHCDGKELDGATFSTVMVAKTNSDAVNYTLTDEFKDSKVDPNNVGDDIKTAAKDLFSIYDKLDKKPKTESKTTNAGGLCSITVTNPGLYLVWQSNCSKTAAEYNASDPMLVFLPNFDSGANKWENSVTLEPKTSKIPTPETPKETEKKDQKNARGAIAVYKVDAADNNVYLQGATFGLYKTDGTKIGTYITNSKGYFKVSDLEYGNYYLIEEGAPEGYIGGTEKIHFTLNASTSYSNDYPWNIKVTNTKKQDTVTPTPETPKDTTTPTQTITTIISKATGDSSNLPIYCGAAAVAAIGIAAFVVYKKKRK